MSPARTPEEKISEAIDRICDRFEAAWLAGNDPEIEAWVIEIEEDHRDRLLRELLIAEWDLRHSRGDNVDSATYLERFGDESRMISEAYSTWKSSQPPVPPSDPGSMDQTVVAGQSEPDANTNWPAVPGYQIRSELGRGGMGIVFLARDENLKRNVALKMVLAGRYASQGERTRFRTEAEALASLRHPNIVRVHEVREHENQLIMALEYVPGGSLESRLNDGPLEPAECASIIERVARGMNAAHQAGFVHRDLKPANILMDAEDNPLVTDFGLAKHLEQASELTQSGTLVGTPSFMAPEQAQGDSTHVGPAADVYSLGATLYACLVGRPPHKADTPLETIRLVIDTEPVPPRQLNDSISQDLETICLKALSKKPANRYVSAAALADDLDACLTNRPISARPITEFARITKWCRRRPALAGLLGTSAAAVLAMLFGALFFTDKLRDERDTARRLKGLAEANEREATNAKQNLERENYRFTIRLAQSRLGTDEAHTVPDLLWSTKKELRGWEWGHLMAQCRLEEWSIAATGPVVKLDATPDRTNFVVATDHSVSLWQTKPLTRRWQVDFKRRVYDVAIHPDAEHVAAVLDAPGKHSIDTGGQQAGIETQVIILSGASGARVKALKPDYRARIAFGREHDSFYVLTAEPVAELLTNEGPKKTFNQAFPGHLHRFRNGNWDTPASTQPVQRSLHVERFLRCGPAGKWLGVSRSYFEYDVYDAGTLSKLEGFRPMKSGSRFRGGDIFVNRLENRILTTHHEWVCQDLNGIRTEIRHEQGRLIAVAPLPGAQSHVALSTNTLIVQKGADTQTFPQPRRCTSFVMLSPDRCLVGDVSGAVRCWNLRSPPPPLPQFGSLVGGSGASLSLAPNSNLAIFRDHERLRLFKAEIFCAGKTVQACAYDELLNVPDSEDPRFESPIPKFAPSGELVEAGGAFLRFRSSDAPPQDLPVGLAPFDVAFDRTGGSLAVSGEDGSLIWLQRNPARRIPARFNTRAPCTVSLSADAKFGLAVAPRESIYIWEPSSGELLFEKALPVTSGAVHPTGKVVALGNEWGEVILIDPTNGEELKRLTSDLARVLDVEFSPDGARLASAGENQVDLWDWQLGEPLLSFDTSAPSKDVEFSRSGRVLAYTGDSPSFNARIAVGWQYDLGDQDFHLALNDLYGRGSVLGHEAFTYPDGGIHGNGGGVGWNRDEAGHRPLPVPTRWRGDEGSEIRDNALRTTNGSTSSRLYRPDDASAVPPGAMPPRAIYYKVTMSRTADTTWSTVSSVGANGGEIAFGIPPSGGPPLAFGIDAGRLQEVSRDKNLPIVRPVNDQRYMLVAKVDMGNRLLSLWIDPDGTRTEDDNPKSAEVAHYLPHASAGIRLASGGAGTVSWDDLVVATSWRDLWRSPEPDPRP